MKHAHKHDSVFLADDDEDDRMLFRDALIDLNADVELTVAKDGAELMETFEDRVPPTPRVLFLDLNMPRKNGFECLSEMKRTDKLKNIPVVIFSTSKDQEFIAKTHKLGAHHFITKPPTFKLLKQVISQVLSTDLHTTPAPTYDKFVLVPE